jgi:putative endopeptidase
MRFMLRFLARNAVAFSLLALATPTAFSQDTATPETHGIVIANMDRSVKPGDDFYLYANGDWIKRTEIPADRGRVSVVTPLVDRTDKRVADLITEAAKGGAAAGDQSRGIANLFNSFMDEAGIEAKGLSPLQRTCTSSRPSVIDTNWRGPWGKAFGPTWTR